MNTLTRLYLPIAALFLASSGALSAAAQETQGDYREFKLPTKPAPSAPVVGPTDETTPRAQRTTPAQQASPTPRPAPRIVLPPPPGASATTTAGTRRQTAPTVQPATQSATRPVAPPTERPAPAPSASSLPFLTPPEPDPSLAGAGIATAEPAPVANTAPGAEPVPSRWWLWALAAAGAAALAGLLLASRKQRGTEQEPEAEFAPPRPITPQPLAEKKSDAAEPLPVSAPVSAPALSLSLQAVRMSATLMNATLSYRLTVENTGPAALRNIAVTGDMIGAHASVPQNEMLGQTAGALPVLHRCASLEPGAVAEWSGEIRLPLAAIVPIQRGEQRLFVPVARIAASAATSGGDRVTSRSAFLVGQDSGGQDSGAQARLQPFRLDLGPRNYSQLGQRALAPA